MADPIVGSGTTRDVIEDPNRLKRACIRYYTTVVKDLLRSPHGELRSAVIKIQQDRTSDHKRDGKLEGPPIRNEHCVAFREALNEPTQAPLHPERCLSKGTEERT